MAVEVKTRRVSKSLPASRKAQAALAGAAKPEKTREVGHQIREMREDYQVQFAKLILSANLRAVPVTVSVEGGDRRAEALAEHLQDLWNETASSMYEAIDYGRVAYEKVYGHDLEHGLTVFASLDPLPYELTQLQLDKETGGFDGIKLRVKDKTVDLTPEQSWWLALDATAMEPHGKSRFSGAPYRVFKDRREAAKCRSVFLQKFALGWIKGHVRRSYEDPETGETVDAMQEILNAIDDMRSGGALLFGNERTKKADGSDGDYVEDVEAFPVNDKSDPIDTAIDSMDAHQLRAMGIPEKTVIEGEAVGSYAMVTQQMRVLFAVVDDILGQMVQSFQRYVVDKAVALNWSENLPRISVSYPPLTERPDSLIVEIVRAMLTSSQLSPLVTENAVDVRQMLEDSGIPVTAELDALLADPTRRARLAPVPLPDVTAPGQAGVARQEFHLANEPQSFLSDVPTRRQLVDDALDALADLYAQLIDAAANKRVASILSIQKRIRVLQGKVAAAGHVLGMLSPWRPRIQASPSGAPRQRPITMALGDVFDFPWLNDALEFLRGKGLMTQEQFDDLDRDEQAAAFSAPGVDDAQVLAELRNAVAESLKEGEGLRDFRRRIEDTVALSRSQTETLFRTQTKQAYIGGMERTLSDPVVEEEFPYVQYAATADTRVRDSHWDLDGMVVRRGTPEHALMLRALADYNCRCTLIPMTEADARRAGVKTMNDLSREARELYG